MLCGLKAQSHQRQQRFFVCFLQHDFATAGQKQLQYKTASAINHGSGA
jgi:hypothetical protein